jgi:hypothetical protein
MDKAVCRSDDQAIAGSLINRSQAYGDSMAAITFTLMTTTSNAILTIPVIPVSYSHEDHFDPVTKPLNIAILIDL